MKIILSIMLSLISVFVYADENQEMKKVDYIKTNIEPYKGKDIEIQKFRMRGDSENSVILEGLTDNVKNLESCEFAIPLLLDPQTKIFTAKDSKGYILCPDVETYLEVPLSITDSKNKNINGVNELTKKSIIVSLK